MAVVKRDLAFAHLQPHVLDFREDARLQRFIESQFLRLAVEEKQCVAVHFRGLLLGRSPVFFIIA